MCVWLPVLMILTPISNRRRFFFMPYLYIFRWSNLNEKVPQKLGEEMNEANAINQLGARFKMLEGMVEGPGSEMKLKDLTQGAVPGSGR
jgi:hypothetical protein